ncbi:hypothetical protein JCM14076_06280 [Methylosoma difficile]
MPTINQLNDEEIEAIRSTFTPVMRAIVGALGIVRAQEFLKQHGGTYITLPKHDGSRLGLNTEELTKLHQALADHLRNDCHIALPKADRIFNVFRNIELRLNRHQYTLNELATMAGISSRHVQNICKQVKVDSLQDDLFN